MPTKAQKIAEIDVQPFLVNGVKLMEVTSDGMLRINMQFKIKDTDAVDLAAWIIDNFQTQIL